MSEFELNSLSEGAMRNVGIGGLIVSSSPDRLRAVLGSCIGFTLWDPQLNVGGLVHCLLPSCPGGDESAPPGKYIDTALPALLDALFREGAQKERIEVKIFGGSTMFKDLTTGSVGGLGERNIGTAQQVVKDAGFRLKGECLGGEKGRMIWFDLESGIVTVRIIGETPREI
jgi:chemotaxis protein CheD